MTNDTRRYSCPPFTLGVYVMTKHSQFVINSVFDTIGLVFGIRPLAKRFRPVVGPTVNVMLATFTFNNDLAYHASHEEVHAVRRVSTLGRVGFHSRVGPLHVFHGLGVVASQVHAREAGVVAEFPLVFDHSEHRLQTFLVSARTRAVSYHGARHVALYRSKHFLFNDGDTHTGPLISSYYLPPQLLNGLSAGAL